MKLIGYAFATGRIDFSREDNPWAFQRIDAGMKASQKDRIVVDPSQAPIELRSAEVNESPPTWMRHAEQLLRSADKLILQYREPGFLRFRKATHDAKQNRCFVTLGNQDEANLFASENWQNLRYLFAYRRDVVRFDVATMITHKSGQGCESAGNRRVEMSARMDFVDDAPRVTFDSSGYNATPAIIEWRGSVREGETGRYAPEKSFISLNLSQVNRPITFLHEDRQEFQNHSYAFTGDKMHSLLARVIKTKLRDAEAS